MPQLLLLRGARLYRSAPLRRPLARADAAAGAGMASAFLWITAPVAAGVRAHSRRSRGEASVVLALVSGLAAFSREPEARFAARTGVLWTE